jgi:hypothetical protein
MPSLGGRHFEGRDFLLQVTKCCQWRHKFATTLKEPFTLLEAAYNETAQEAQDAQIILVLFVPLAGLLT